MAKAQTKFLSALILSVVAQTTFAAGSASFVGIGLGNTYAEATNGTGQLSTSSTGYRFIAGSQINPMFAVEAEYVDLGEYAGTNANVGAKGLGIAGVITWPVTGMFSIFGKGGLTRIETTVSPNSNSVPSTPLSDTVVGVTLGYGIQMDVAPNASICLSWDRYKTSALAGPFTDRIDMNSSGLLILRF